MKHFYLNIIIVTIIFIKSGSAICKCKKASSNCTGPNEVWTVCDNNSCQKNCEIFHMNLACKPICNPGCICQKGYLRNTQGVCVLPNNCDVPVCPGENEEYSSCVSPCGPSCATLGRQITCNFLVCNPGCDCRPGYLRNSTGVCVLPTHCDCPKHEELVICNNPCPPEGCEDIGKIFECGEPTECKPACKCVANYRRDSDGTCIPEEQCPNFTP